MMNENSASAPDGAKGYTGDGQSNLVFYKPDGAKLLTNASFPYRRKFTASNTRVTLPWTPECIGSFVDTGKQCNICNRWHFSPLWMAV